MAAAAHARHLWHAQLAHAVLQPLALPAHASPYTVGVLVWHSATQAVLGIGLQTFFVVDPPPWGVLFVTPQSGMCLTPRSQG